MPKYLGIDFGLKRVGIAITDENLTIAFQRDHIPNDKNLCLAISKIAAEEGITRIVIGLPVALSGERNEQTEITEKFAHALRSELGRQRVSAETDFIDERLTSRIAEAEVVKTGMKKSKRRDKGVIDRMSAQIILQNYIDREKNLGRQGTKCIS